MTDSNLTTWLSSQTNGGDSLIANWELDESTGPVAPDEFTSDNEGIFAVNQCKVMT